MADSKLSALYSGTPYTVGSLLDLLYSVDVSDTTDGAGGSSKGALVSLILGMLPDMPGARLSVSGSDWLGSGTGTSIYFYPEEGDTIRLFDGSAWRLVTNLAPSIVVTTLRTSQFTGNGTLTNGSGVISSISSTTGMYVGQPVGGTSVGTGAVIVTVDSSTQITVSVNSTASATVSITCYHANYDIFGYISSNTCAIEGLAWTNNNTRATSIAIQGGRYCKNAAQDRLYLGTVRLNSSTTINDSTSQRFVWNMFNRQPRQFLVTEGTDTWNYTTATFRAANGNSANSCQILLGLANREKTKAQVYVNASNSPTGANAAPGIGIDSTTTDSSQIRLGRAPGSVTTLMCHYEGYPTVGYHRIHWIEKSEETSTTTWYGDNGDSTLMAAGMTGEVWC
jgi:hypothetical protein